MKQPRLLIKLGGAALETTTTLEFVTEAIQEFQEHGYQIILVHGGGPAINAELRRLGITWQFVGGQRVTSPQMMNVIDYTLSGTVNRRLNHHFRSKGLKTYGCSGAEHQTLLCTQASLELGQVGQIESVNTSHVELVLNEGYIPVLAPLGVGVNGERFNINADWAASHLAVALGVDQLIFLTDQVGIMDEEGKIISKVDAAGLRNMCEAQIVSGGMLTKTKAVLHALDQGLRTVRVLSAPEFIHGIPAGERGTKCVANASVKMQETIYATV